MTERDCPVCGVSIPVNVKPLPHDHDDENNVRQSHKDFYVMAPHHYAKDPGLLRCDGSGAIIEIETNG